MFGHSLGLVATTMKVFDGWRAVCRVSAMMKVFGAMLTAIVLSAGAVFAQDAAPKGEPDVENGYLVLGFDRLASFKFVAPPFDPDADANKPPPTGEEQIPAEVKAWSGKKAIVTGYMLPTRMAEGLVTEFLLVKDPAMCCYGTVPNMNEWVVVKMAKGVRPLMDVPIAFHGEFKVGAMFENGYMTGIYLLEGEKMGEVRG
jgi:Uncharacterized protein conserved in bacteria